MLSPDWVQLKKKAAKVWPFLWAFFVLSSVSLPQVWVLIQQEEKWPFTNAPMFAHPVGNGSTRYRFEFILINKDGQATPLSLKELQFARTRLLRHFFSSVYGGADKDSPFNKVDNDFNEKFQHRLEYYFRNFVKVVKARDLMLFKDARLLQLRVVAENGENSVLVGYYDLLKDRFIHLGGRYL